jgi:hypothetical protein
VHVEVFGPSPAWVYRVLPFAPARKVPRLAELAVPMATAPAAADAGPLLAGAGLVPGDPPLAEHAATTKLALRTRAAMVR